ncbi:LysM domain-containing protein [Arenimonas terrae]|uniref:LysM domain-containing protein n=2 Tax=Arenimonas terrae TaxID=2546226 RepID=A0A5C4RX53_9GAMM|nr:LysM domain-containing protein [Arenimonas terrae]
MHRQADGRGNPYLARRFVPAAGQFAELGQHSVVEGDRLDLLASRYFSDPEQYWKLCDANGALRPDALVEAIGRSLSIGIHTDMASSA